MQQEITKLINQNSEIFENAFLHTNPSDEELALSEKELGLKLPTEYVWFLKEYGHGGFFFDFLGFGKNRTPLFVEKTLYERSFGLPQSLLVIEDNDEYVTCIDTVSDKIVTWSKHDRDGIIYVSDNFYVYFIDRIINAINNY